jgi:branched-chain amino acid transport system substrate-binding protein
VVRFDRRQALKLVAAAGAVGLTGACARDAPVHTGPAEAPVRIGLIIPQTGVLKSIGSEMVNGFQLYLDLNQRRLGGRTVNLIAADERDAPEAGRAAIDSLLGQNVVAMVGVADSALLLAVRDRVEEAKVPLLAAGGAPRALQNLNAIWCTSYVDDEPGQVLGAHVARTAPPGGRVAIVAPTSPAGQEAVSGFRQSFGPTDPRISDPVVWTEADLRPRRGFFTAALDRVQAMGAGTLFCHYGGAAAVEFLKQLRATGLRPQVYGTGVLTEGGVLAQAAEEAQGIRTALNYATDLSNDANRRFAATYRRAHGVAPSAAAVASYDAAQVLDKAIRIAGGRLTAQDINRAIARVGQIDSPRGTWQFNQPHTPQQRWYLREVRPDGQVLSNVTVSELATLG